MELFSRRIVSRMLEENRRFLPKNKSSRHLNHLNGNSAIQRLTTEWEIAVLYGLSKLGVDPKFEPALEGGTGAPDVLVTYESNPALIEITTASDRGLDEENKVQEISDELIRRVRARGLNPDNFGIEIEGNWRDLHLGGPKARLSISHLSEFDSFIFNQRFSQFLDEIDSSRQKATFRPRPDQNALLTITYDPAQRFFSCGHLDYTVAFTPRNNPVYNRLHTKAGKLKKAGFRGVVGIVLCDAGCNVLSRTGQRGLDLGANDVISNFLQEQPFIAFVLTLLVTSDGKGRLGPDHLTIVGRMYTSRGHPCAGPLVDFLDRNLAEQLPRPENTPINGYSTKNEGKSFSGGGELTSNSLKMSARAVLAVLSGQIKQDDFIRDNQQFAEMFGRVLREGRVLSEVRIEHVPHRDDDWIEFHFSEPDPAVGPFRRGSKS